MTIFCKVSLCHFFVDGNNKFSFTILSFQILGLDQFTTTQSHLGRLNDIHADLVISMICTIMRMYPFLRSKPVHLFIEANLSQDLSSYVNQVTKTYFKINLPHVKIGIVKQYDAQGNLLPGVLTRHKENLVSYFKRLLDEGIVFVASQVCSIGRAIEMKYEDECIASKIRYGVEETFCPNEEEMTRVLQTFVKQASEFRCYKRGSSIIFSGKKNGKGRTTVDDLVMAVIIATSWARLPKNTYVVE